jgi:GNAT superfamily N-acetyltransferase
MAGHLEHQAVSLSAELRLQVAEGKTAVLRFAEREDEFALEIMMVPSHCRGQGHGSLLLKRLLAVADVLCKPVVTVARPLGGGNSPDALDRLVRYYERFGFRAVRRGLTTVHMRRLPNGMEPVDDDS